MLVQVVLPGGREGGREGVLLALPNLQIQELINLLELYKTSQTKENKNNFYMHDKEISKRKPQICISQRL